MALPKQAVVAMMMFSPAARQLPAALTFDQRQQKTGSGWRFYLLWREVTLNANCGIGGGKSDGMDGIHFHSGQQPATLFTSPQLKLCNRIHYSISGL
jgi:hypothetical protein